MKTTILKLHGVNVEFSEQPPTRVGAYWWGPNKEDFIAPMRVIDCDGVLCDFSTLLPITKFGGLWSTSPLVPSVEVERAYEECARTSAIIAYPKTIPTMPQDSRARRVVEGAE